MKDSNDFNTLSSFDRKNTKDVIDLLERGRQGILSAWVDLIRAEFNEPKKTSNTSDEQLADHMTYIVDAIIAELLQFETDSAHSKSLDQGDLLYDQGEIEDKKGGGKRHGKQRAGINAYNADMVYWEYVLLRKVIIEYVQKNRQLDIDHLELITSVIEKCARESMLVFIESIQKVQRKLLSSIIHDIRSPLNVISMTSELAQINPEASALPTYFEKIQSSSGRISDMLEDMLLTLSAEAGQGLDLDFNEGNLNFFLSASVLEARALYGDRLKLKLPKYEVDAIYDESVMKRVFENLISNAFKYGNTDSDVTLSMMDTEDLIIMDIHNFGDPISKEHWADIFKFLRRFEGKKRQKRNSWGIGLAFVKAAVEGHKGKITFSSDEHEGTRFVVELPKNALKKGHSVTVPI